MTELKGFINDVSVLPESVIFSIKPETISGDKATLQPYFYKNAEGDFFVLQGSASIAKAIDIQGLKQKAVTLNFLEGTPELTIEESGDTLRLLRRQ